MDLAELGKVAVMCTLQTIYFAMESLIKWFIPESTDLKGKVVLVTGSAGGLGQLVAMKFGSLGCKVVLWDIDSKKNEETARLVRLSASEGAEAHPYVCDVTDNEAVIRNANDVKKNVGPVDILVNNAGIVQGKSFMETTDKDIQKTFAVNTFSHFWTCKQFLPDMMERNSGHIVTVSSVAGKFGTGGLTDYCASKFAASGLHESLMLELVGKGYDGISGTLICPYFINTGMFNGVKAPFPLLEVDYAADQIISAVLAKKAELLMPLYFHAMLLLKCILPHKAFVAIYKALNGPEVMSTFTGHAKSQ